MGLNFHSRHRLATPVGVLVPHVRAVDPSRRAIIYRHLQAPPQSRVNVRKCDSTYVTEDYRPNRGDSPAVCSSTGSATHASSSIGSLTECLLSGSGRRDRPSGHACHPFSHEYLGQAEIGRYVAMVQCRFRTRLAGRVIMAATEGCHLVISGAEERCQLVRMSPQREAIFPLEGRDETMKLRQDNIQRNGKSFKDGISL